MLSRLSFLFKKAEDLLKKRSFRFCGNERGSVLFYIFLAVGLLAAVTYAFVKDSRQGVTTQNAYRIAEELQQQIQMIRAGVQECVLEYPGGGGDLDASGVVDDTDNPNTPYPLDPSNALNPGGAAANDQVRNLQCVGAPDATRWNIFQGANNQGRNLAPIPSGFSEWTYTNDADGVYIQTTAPQDASSIDALNRLLAKYESCQAELNYGACGARCLTVWIKRVVAC